jgi:membrane protein
MEMRASAFPGFMAGVLRDFFLRNHGLMLSGSVAFNLMLSLVPLGAVLMVVFSQFIDAGLLQQTLSRELAFVAPGFAPMVEEAVAGFMRNRGLAGWIGVLSLLFFSSKAFRVMEDAMSVIFHRPVPSLRRHFLLSALMPFLFILIVAAGLILITAAHAVLDAGGGWLRPLPWIGRWTVAGAGLVLYAIGSGGLVVLFTLFYKIMPVAHVPWRHAFAGGLLAAVLWEGVRHLLVGYYARVSMVNLIYGSMASLVVGLLTLEAVAVIVLLGAQVIANSSGTGEEPGRGTPGGG